MWLNFEIFIKKHNVKSARNLSHLSLNSFNHNILKVNNKHLQSILLFKLFNKIGNKIDTKIRFAFDHCRKSLIASFYRLKAHACRLLRSPGLSELEVDDVSTVVVEGVVVTVVVGSELETVVVGSEEFVGVVVVVVLSSNSLLNSALIAAKIVLKNSYFLFLIMHQKIIANYLKSTLIQQMQIRKQLKTMTICYFQSKLNCNIEQIFYENYWLN